MCLALSIESGLALRAYVHCFLWGSSHVCFATTVYLIFSLACCIFKKLCMGDIFLSVAVLQISGVL
jgi:hypothetical protein